MISFTHSTTVINSVPAGWDRESVISQMTKAEESIRFWQKSYGYWLDIRSGLRRDGNLVEAGKTRASIERCVEELERAQERVAYYSSMLARF